MIDFSQFLIIKSKSDKLRGVSQSQLLSDHSDCVNSRSDRKQVSGLWRCVQHYFAVEDLLLRRSSSIASNHLRTLKKHYLYYACWSFRKVSVREHETKSLRTKNNWFMKIIAIEWHCDSRKFKLVWKAHQMLLKKKCRKEKTISVIKWQATRSVFNITLFAHLVYIVRSRIFLRIKYASATMKTAVRWV